MSNKKSGTTPHERVTFLREHGYTEHHSAAGSHVVWINMDLKTLAQQQAIEMPLNLRSNVAQKAWEICLPDNPGTGTWLRIERQAEWAQETVMAVKEAAEKRQREKLLREEFKAQREEILGWRKEVKHCYKAGVSLPPAPAIARFR